MAQVSLDTYLDQAVAKKPAVNAATLLVGLVTAIGLGAGLYAMVAGHHHVFATTREVPWGLLISTYAFFAITSTGLCLLAFIGHAFGGTPIAALGNRAVFLSIATIMAAFSVIGLELESPWRMLIYNVISPNFTSNIWWMGTLYGLAVGCMLVEFLAILTRSYKIALALGALGALAEVGANTNLGAVFATLSARPFWYGAQLPVFFLCCAFASGAAAIILFTHIAHKMRGTKPDEATFTGLQSAGKVLALTLFLLGVATAWRFISFFVGGSELGRLAAMNLLTGPMSFNFWVFEIVIGLALPLLILVGTQMKSLAAMSAASLMTLVGGFIQRYDLVVAGQQVPVYYGWDNLPSFLGYTPSIAEMLLAAGGTGVALLLFLLGEKYFGKVFRPESH